MSSRQIAIIAGAVIGAFLLAFGIGKAAGGGDDATPTGKKATAIGVQTPAVEGFDGTGTVPALEKEKDKEKEEADATPAATTDPGSDATPAPTSRPPLPTSTPRPDPTSTPTPIGEDDGRD